LEQSLLTTWNAQVVDYDHDKYPFADWVLGRIRKMGYDLDDLTRLHEVVPDGEVYKVSKQLCADTNLQEFRRMLNAFTREIVVGKGKLRPPIAVQRFLNVRIMLPNKPEGIFPFHTGLLYGHGIASRSLWMPLTDVRADEDATASMQIIGTERSRELVRYAVENKLSVTEMTELFRKESWPIKAGPGSLCFSTIVWPRLSTATSWRARFRAATSTSSRKPTRRRRPGLRLSIPQRSRTASATCCT
jgi:hypothetical protein